MSRSRSICRRCRRRSTSPTPLDTGATAYATLDAGAVSATTLAASLQPGNVSNPALLASTVDADTNDPYIQETAAALDYDPTQIFDYLQTQVGYNSYLGSVRGARGTLWSGAGNSLDVASLGVALMRASGIPAQYAQGTLTQSQAQPLILSMFPASAQIVGTIPAGTQTANPTSDPQLLSETESHYWFQFQSGSAMTDADPLMPGATIGHAFTTSAGTFSAVPDSLEETTEIQLVAEIDNTADSLFGQSGLADTTVLDQTFDDAALVGRPLSIGNLVSQSGTSAIFTVVTNTYTPFLDMGDDAFPPSHDETTAGTPYQEVLTNFPFGSQILTGLFLNVTLSGPQGASQTYSRTLVDRIGAAARAGLASASPSINPSGPPIPSLAARLSDLSTALTNLVENPTSTVYAGQAQAALGRRDQPALHRTGPLRRSRHRSLPTARPLQTPRTAPAVQSAVTSLGNDLGTLSQTLTDLAAHGFELSFLTNSAVGRPQVATTYQLMLKNDGSQTTTYNLSLGTLPAGVNGSLSQTTITLAPGEVTPGSPGVPPCSRASRPPQQPSSRRSTSP